MSKTLKMGILLVIITLGFLFLGTEVKAVDINPAALVESFEGKDVTINGTTITLNDDVDFLGDVVCFYEGDFVLDLNGHTVTAGEMYIEDGKLTIEDSKGNGKIDVGVLISGEVGTLIINNGIFSTDRKQEDNIYGENGVIVGIYYLYVDTYIECYGTATINGGTFEGGVVVWENGKCTVNNGKMSTITNEGNLTINNATVSSIMNTGTITIEDGSFGGINQDGKATINGGVFTAHEEYMEYSETASGEIEGGYVTRMSMINVDMDTILNGGEFKKDGDNVDSALDIYSNESNSLTLESIEELVGAGFVAEYEGKSWGTNVNYNYVKIVRDKLLENIAPNGVWDLGGLKPKDFILANEMLSKLVMDVYEPLGYGAYASVSGDEENFDPEKVTICVYNDKGFEKKYSVTMKYLPKDAEEIGIVTPVLKKMRQYKDYSETSVKDAYVIEDLYLINYLFANADREYLNEGQALNFSKELIDAIGGANISFDFIPKTGDGTPNRLYAYSSGEVIVYYEGKPLTTMLAASLRNYVLYIPDTVDVNDDDAVIAAATKRIKDYIGEDVNFTIKTAGTLASIKAYNPYTLYDETKTGDNYYHLKIGEKSYNFVICKKEDSKLEQPKYLGNNLESNIVVTSDSTEIPLDTSISVEKKENETIEKALGTSVYAAYDITLYSNAKETRVTELENGMFKVSIPVPEKLNNIENLTVYYIDDNGNKYDYNGKVDNETRTATFETNHFSTYAIAEKETYTVNFDGNGGTFKDRKTLTIEKWENGIEDTLETPTREGYKFLGFFTEKTGGTKLELILAESGIDDDMTFYAQWQEVSDGGGVPGIPEGGEQEDNNNTGNTNTGNTNTGNTNTNKPTGNNPQTGDNIVMFTVISLMAFVGIMVVIKIKKYLK